MGRSREWKDSPDDRSGDDWFDGRSDDSWVSGEAFAEILALELAFQGVQSVCPRCDSPVFTYGRLIFCTPFCPENLLVTQYDEVD